MPQNIIEIDKNEVFFILNVLEINETCEFFSARKFEESGSFLNWEHSEVRRI